ncbi:MAG: TonB-dependent receptor [Bacteroidota bacterium]
MKKTSNFLFLTFLVCYSLPVLSQEKVSINGYVRDSQNGESLIQATLTVVEARTGTYTNAYGFYSLTLMPGEYTLIVSYLGYERETVKLSLDSTQTLDFELQSKAISTETVVIQAEQEDENVSHVQMSTVKLGIQEIRRMPQLLGEVDIIRSIQLLPGVTTVGEGASGFNVRGGNVDQNLILLDEAPVYNSSHLFGFFSVFNSDAIKDVKLFKGGIPAEYGGRLSSVLDIRQKEGNNKKFSGTGGIGLISSRLLFEGPLGSEKASFMVAGRRSYMDLFLKLSSDEEIRGNTIYFYDLNAKVNYRIGEKDQIFASAYLGNDVFRFRNDFKMRWGNQTGTLRWNHLFSEKVFSNFTLNYSNYEYELGVPEDPENIDPFSWTSSILNVSAKGDWGWYISPKVTLKYGGSMLYYKFQPGEVEFFGDTTNFSDFTINPEYALESGIYVSVEQFLGNRLNLQYGLRFSHFVNMGAGNVYVYNTENPESRTQIIDTLAYDSFEKIRSFHGWEPRIALRYTLNENTSLKASYNRTKQYIHLVSNTTAATPIDVWKPSGAHVNPAMVDQFAVGIFRNFRQNTYESSIEVFYKEFQDLLDFKDGAELLFNQTVETELLSGNGRAYGAELMVRKSKGKTTGWLGYTLSRSERKVEEINNGEYYPSNYDKLHDISLVLGQKLNEKWEVSTNFAFMSGRAVTYPNARYLYEGISPPNFDNRNGARTPAYHRLDLAVNWEISPVEKAFKQSLSFGVYNVYGRRNPYSIYFRQNADNPQQNEAVQLSIFAAPIPYVTWNFKF